MKEKKKLTGLGERLSLLLKELRIVPAQLAKELGLSESTIYYYMSNRSEPPLWVLKYLREKYNADLNWLITGEGSPLSESTPVEKRYLIGERLSVILEELSLSTGELLSELSTLYLEPELRDYIENKKATPESIAKEIATALGLNYSWLIFGKGEKYNVKREYFTAPVDFRRYILDGAYIPSIIYTTECSSDNGNLLFFIYFKHAKYKYGGFTLVDPTDYDVWNWFDEQHRACYLKSNLWQVFKISKDLSFTGLDVFILDIDTARKLARGDMHPLKAPRLQAYNWFIWDIEDRVTKDYKSFEGKPYYGLARLLVEYFYKCDLIGL